MRFSVLTAIGGLGILAMAKSMYVENSRDRRHEVMLEEQKKQEYAANLEKMEAAEKEERKSQDKADETATGKLYALASKFKKSVMGNDKNESADE
jgi:hypothetical protein